MSASAPIADSPLRQAWTRGPASMQAGSPLGRSTYCFKYASLPRGSARLSRVATARFRDEPS